MAVTAGAWLTQTFASAGSFTTTSTKLEADDYLIVSVVGSTSAFTTGTWTISDSSSGTWVQVENQNNTTVGKSWFRTTPGGSANITITITTTVASGLLLIATNFSGSSGQYVTPTTNFGTTVTANVATPALTTPAAVQAGDMYYSIVRGQPGSGPTWTAGSGWTASATNTFGSSRTQFSQKRLATSSGTVTSNATPSVNMTNYSTMAIVVKMAITTQPFSGWGIPL